MKPRHPRVGSLVEFVWGDAWSKEQGWEAIAVKDCSPAMMSTVGYVRATSKYGIVTAGTISVDDQAVIGEHFRPWGMITKLRVIK